MRVGECSPTNRLTIIDDRFAGRNDGQQREKKARDERMRENVEESRRGEERRKKETEAALLNGTDQINDGQT